MRAVLCAVKRSRARPSGLVLVTGTASVRCWNLCVSSSKKKKQYKGVGGQKERRETWEEVGREERNKSEKK